MPTTIVTRAGKGAPLSHGEVDANFTNLQTTADAAYPKAGAATITGAVTIEKNGAALTIDTVSAVDGSIDFKYNGTLIGGITVSTNLLRIGTEATYGMIFRVNGATAAQFDNAGNLGIGTPFPNARLHIANAGNVVIFDSGAASNGSVNFWYNGSGRGTLYIYSDSIQLIAAPTYYLALGAAGSEAVWINTSQNVGVGTPSPSVKLDVNSDAMRLRTAKTPASATAAGDAGTICWDASYIYICTATNTWKRSAIASW